MNFPRHGGHDKVKTDQYWAFGYSFLTLDDEAKHHRRELLEWYPLVAQWAVLVVLALFQIIFFLDWLVGRGLDYERPRSPSFNKRLEGKWTWLKKTRHGWTRMMWWLKKDITPYWNWGTRGEWLAAAVWTIWLLYCCVVNTGEDYLHLTKRFGIIAASQLPIHYLLAMRAPYSPIQWLTRLSHEQLKSVHEILGRIIFFLLALHGSFYLNFFVLSGWLGKRIKDKDVIFGIISLLLFTMISTTALEQVRRRNYRIFYTSHIIIANIIVIPLALHVSHIWLYVGEIILVNSLHLFFRARRLKIYDGTIKLIPGTNLVQIRVPLASLNSALNWRPGQHVYLSLPTGKAYTDSAKDQFVLRSRTNPLSVASIPVKDKEILLVAKTLNGNTKKLAELARSLSTAGDAPTIPIGLEGPYGASARLPDLSDFDRVLLVAGGVGATFIMPIYRSILEYHAPTPGGTAIRCIWAVQKLAETQWAFPADSKASEEGDDSDSDSDSSGAQANGASHDSSAVEVFVTRLSGPSLHIGESGEEIELAEDDQLLSMEEQMEKPHKGMVLKAGRPKMKTIVDDVFSKGTRIAVICCGPKRLTEGLRKSVEQWVVKGYDVYWHDESFSW